MNDGIVPFVLSQKLLRFDIPRGKSFIGTGSEEKIITGECKRSNSVGVGLEG